MTDMLLINIPLSGFYNSHWSALIDNEEEAYLDHVEECPENHSKAIGYCGQSSRLSRNLWLATNHDDAYQVMAKDYADAYIDRIMESLGLPKYSPDWPNITYESMESPREYNFTTDRLFIKADVSAVEPILKRVTLPENISIFGRLVDENFTSRSGFASFYSNDPEALLEKPLVDWDHNELRVLLEAWREIEDFNPDDDLLDIIGDNSHNYFENAVNWTKLEEMCQNDMESGETDS